MDEILLTPFAPLIQFWAGVCLIFFYEPLLENFPLSKYQKEKEELFDNFLGKNQGFFRDEQLDKGYKIIKSKWSLFYKTIQNLSTLLFLYAIFLLSYIGIESVRGYEHYYCALQIMNCAVIGYVICAWLFYKTSIFKGIISAIIYFSFLLTFFHTHHIINNFLIEHHIILGCYWSRTEVTILTVFTCVLSVFIILLQLIIDYIGIWYIKRRIKSIDSTINTLGKLLFGEKDTNLPEKIKKKAALFVIDNNFNIEALSEFAQHEIDNEFDSFIESWYCKPYKYCKRLWTKLYNKVIKSFSTWFLVD